MLNLKERNRSKIWQMNMATTATVFKPEHSVWITCLWRWKN